MKKTVNQSIVLCVIYLTAASGISNSEIEELEVGLEFLEFDLEDHCVSRNEELLKFFNGTSKNLDQLIKNEKNSERFTKDEVEKYKRFTGVPLNNAKVERQLNMLNSIGPTLMPEEIYKEYVAYAAEAQANATLPRENLNTSSKIVNSILETEKNATVRSQVWIDWATNLDTSCGDLSQQLSLLDLEAEANGADNTEDYWLKQSEISLVNYDGAAELWKSITPLYQKLRQWLAVRIAKINSKVFINQKLIPVHMLGSLSSSDWIAAADWVNGFDGSESYKAIRSSLQDKSIKELYTFADEITSELHLGYLPGAFFKTSQFEVGSETCVPLVETFCKSESPPRVLSCKGEASTVSRFLDAHEDVAYIKHLSAANSQEQGYLFREGPRDSVLYEAISSAASLLALSPINLERRGLFSKAYPDANITSLLLNALRIIPAMPLHLSYDLWRLQALKAMNPEDKEVVNNTTDSFNATTSENNNATESVTDQIESKTTNNNIDEDDEEDEEEEEEHQPKTHEVNETEADVPVYDRANLTADWWDVRGKIQGVGSPNLQPYADYLSEPKILWNKPYISKFLGPILLFQILSNFKTENTTENIEILQRLLRKGKSQPWEQIMLDFFNITQFDTAPLLRYFKPLETFLDGGGKFNNKSNELTGFSENDIKLFLQSGSLGSGTKKDVVSASEDSDAILIVIIGIIVIGALAAVISVVKKRYDKKQRAKRRRKLDLLRST